MNGNTQSQQEQHLVAERVARLETAIDYQGQGLACLRDEVRAGFVRADAEFERVHAEFVRVHEQLVKIRTTDFRILQGISLSTALGMAGLIIKAMGLLPTP